MTDVFISYSRRNLDFVHKLDAALITQGKVSWFDQKKEPLEGIPPGSKWWEEIKHGIETADNFLFIISPASIASPYCNAEIAHAIQHERRIVTVLYRGVTGEADTLRAIDAAIDAIPNDSELPSNVSATITNLQSLARRNWLEISRVQYVPLSDEGAFDPPLKLLVQALDMDLAWLRTWSQIRQSARIWADTGDNSYLWSEMRLKPVREMIEQRGQELTEVERAFIRPEAERLLAELEDIDLPHARRSVIGERLSVIGDPRPGVGLRPDGLPDIVWCYVPGGSVTLEDHGTGKVEPFYIAKYLITYAQFQAFIDAEDGFHTSQWWKGLAASGDHKRAPNEQRFKFANHPREMVSWYDTVVFCRWLTARLPGEAWPEETRTAGSAAAGQGRMGRLFGREPERVSWELRLPTEWEWQQAATGGEPENEYPWGPEWDGRRANTVECGLSRTTAVGMYPHGAARLTQPDGEIAEIMDMSGNVWEWCLNEYSDPKNFGLGRTEWRVLRGGGWFFNQDPARAVYRHYLDPRHWFNHLGFRVVCARPPSL